MKSWHMQYSVGLGQSLCRMMNFKSDNRAGGSGQAGPVLAGPLFHSSKKKREFFVDFHQLYVPEQAFQSTHISFPPRNCAMPVHAHTALISFPDPEIGLGTSENHDSQHRAYSLK